MMHAFARRRINAYTVGVVLGVAVLWTPALAQNTIDAQTLTDEHVRLAIDVIVEELYARKQPKRFWEPKRTPVGESKQGGGYTALTVLSLLHAGETYQDPRLRDAVAYLERLGMDGTYAVALRTHVWAMLPPKFAELLALDTRWLLNGFSERASGWNYRQQPDTTRRDNSITQYGTLALWEAAKRGFSVDRRYWQMLEDRFLDMQLADGGWNYAGDGPATGSMTTAGLAALFVTEDLLHAGEAADVNAGRNARSQQAIERGLQWMQRNFSPTQNPGRDEYFFYYLYGVERVGLASGYKYIGSHDWYREAAAELIRRLCRWDPAARSMTVYEKHGRERRSAKVQVQHLAFGLLFLSRGRIPVAVNKLAAADLAWNNRPRDMANLVRWLSQDTESALNWQIVSLEAEPHEWLDAPMLYLASHQRLPWLEPGSQLEKLKRYLDLGGLLFAVSEGSARAFSGSVEAAGSRMYPDYRWRALPKDHWAYTLHRTVQGRRPPLRGLSNGVRELIILSPSTDFAKVFQTRATERANIYQTASNIYLYASEMNRPRPRLARHFVSAEPFQNGDGTEAEDSRPRQPAATIVRAVHDGAWNPEPQALEVFRAAAGNDGGALSEVELRIIDRPLSQVHALDARPTLVLVNGIEPHDFSGDEREAIRQYVEAGGVIFFETPGGRGGFTRSAEEACAEIFVDSPVHSMLRTRVITGAGLPGAAKLTRLEYRPFALEVFAARETTPRLRGMVIDGQPRVLFSREDITHGLLDQPCWGIAGYTPDTARALLTNILLHGLDLTAQFQREED